MLKLINEKFNIGICYIINSKGLMEDVQFLSSNMVEINAFVMDDIKEYQDDIKEEIKVLENAKTKEDIIDYLIRYAGWEIVENFKEEEFENGYNSNEDTYLLDFEEFKIAVRK